MSKLRLRRKCWVLTVCLLMGRNIFAGETVVVMGPGAAPLSKDLVANIYLGRNTTLKPLELPTSSATRRDFCKKATGRDMDQLKAVWVRLLFTGGGQPPKEMPDDAAVKKAVAADPRAIGYIDKSSVDASVTVLLELD